jgi:hypothetical protein
MGDFHYLNCGGYFNHLIFPLTMISGIGCSSGLIFGAYQQPGWNCSTSRPRRLGDYSARELRTSACGGYFYHLTFPLTTCLATEHAHSSRRSHAGVRPAHRETCPTRPGCKRTHELRTIVCGGHLNQLIVPSTTCLATERVSDGSRSVADGSSRRPLERSWLRSCGERMHELRTIVCGGHLNQLTVPLTTCLATERVSDSSYDYLAGESRADYLTCMEPIADSTG